MIKIEIVLKTDDRKVAPEIMKKISEKISNNDNLTGENHPDYYFRTSKIDNVLEIFD